MSQEQKQQRISDLLAHRDGERLDPEVSAQIDADPHARGELDVLRRVKHELNELPAIDPDPAVWERISQASDRSRPQQSRRSWALRYPLATAASVFLAAALAIVAWNPLREDADGSALVLADGGLQDLMSRSRTLEAQL
ncbi:MAG: hypothetical protein OES38_20310, partial [Gammaproteobacteria bacterium]|nr:hypothetical protein [Gammaproteobacteria bacterium]